MITKVLGWIAVALVVIWIVKDPSQAGDDVHTWATGLIHFLDHASSG